MKHIEYAFDQKNQIWRYVLMIFVVFIAINTLGIIPLVLIAAISSFANGIALDTANIMDFTALGIDPNLGLATMIFTFIVGLFAFILFLSPLHNRDIIGVINGRAAIRWDRIWVGFSVWAAFVIISSGVSYLATPEDYTLQFNLKSFIPLFIITLLMIPFQSSLEEVIFRGYLMQGLGTKTKSRFWSMIILSATFALMHSANPEVEEFGFALVMPQYLIMGLLLGIVSVLDDGIEIALGIHASNNILVALLVTHDASVFQTPAIFIAHNINPLSDLIQLVLISALFIYILQRKYKWQWNTLFLKVKPNAEERSYIS